MDLLNPVTLTYLIPNYHEKKADGIQMFFCMTNASLFERCRQLRNQFESIVKTPAFQQTFQTEFFQDNGTVFLLEKYNEFSLYVMIEMARTLLQPFTKGSQGGGRRNRTYRNKQRGRTHRNHSSLWKILQMGGVNNLIPVSKGSSALAGKDNQSIHAFLQQVPYNGIFGNEYQVNVSQLILSRVFTNQDLASLKTNNVIMASTFLISLYVQHVASGMIPFATLRKALKTKEGGGRGSRFGASSFRGQKSRKSVPYKAPAPKQYTPKKYLPPPPPPSKPYTPVQQYIYTPPQPLYPTLSVQRYPTSRGKVSPVKILTILALLTTASVAQELQAPRDPLEFLRSSVEYGTPLAGNMRDMKSMFEFTNGAEGFTALTVSQASPSMRGNTMGETCFLSTPLGGPVEVGGVFDSQFVELTRSVHAISARNATASEYSFAMVLDETTGMLKPNATVATTYQRGETCLPGFTSSSTPTCYQDAVVPLNTAMYWHFHPWDVHDRINTHMSQADLRLVLEHTMYNGVPYQAAHTPEGVYVYSLQNTTLTGFHTVVNKGGFLAFREASRNIINSYNMPLRLQCDDFTTRKITSFENIGTVTVEVEGEAVSIPFGYDITFYNQEYLSKGGQIQLPLYKEWKKWDIQLSFQQGEMVPKLEAQPGMNGQQTWMMLSDVFQEQLPGMARLNPFAETKPTREAITQAHGFNTTNLTGKVLADSSRFGTFQKQMKQNVSRALTKEQRNIREQQNITEFFTGVPQENKSQFTEGQKLLRIEQTLFNRYGPNAIWATYTTGEKMNYYLESLTTWIKSFV